MAVNEDVGGVTVGAQVVGRPHATPATKAPALDDPSTTPTKPTPAADLSDAKEVPRLRPVPTVEATVTDDAPAAHTVNDPLLEVDAGAVVTLAKTCPSRPRPVATRTFPFRPWRPIPATVRRPAAATRAFPSPFPAKGVGGATVVDKVARLPHATQTMAVAALTADPALVRAFSATSDLPKPSGGTVIVPGAAVHIHGTDVDATVKSHPGVDLGLEAFHSPTEGNSQHATLFYFVFLYVGRGTWPKSFRPT